MYKLLTFICVCALYIDSVYSAQAIQPAVEPPAKYAGQPGCYETGTDSMLPLGNSYPPASDKNCIVRNCDADGSIKYSTCGAIRARGCQIIEDFSKTYPDCCPQAVKCDRRY